jgi:hypothetical protein
MPRFFTSAIGMGFLVGTGGGTSEKLKNLLESDSVEECHPRPKT